MQLYEEQRKTNFKTKEALVERDTQFRGNFFHKVTRIWILSFTAFCSLCCFSLKITLN